MPRNRRMWRLWCEVTDDQYKHWWLVFSSRENPTIVSLLLVEIQELLNNVNSLSVAREFHYPESEQLLSDPRSESTFFNSGYHNQAFCIVTRCTKSYGYCRKRWKDHLLKKNFLLQFSTTQECGIFISKTWFQRQQGEQWKGNRWIRRLKHFTSNVESCWLVYSHSCMMDFLRTLFLQEWNLGLFLTRWNFKVWSFWNFLEFVRDCQGSKCAGLGLAHFFISFSLQFAVQLSVWHRSIGERLSGGPAVCASLHLILSQSWKVNLRNEVRPRTAALKITMQFFKEVEIANQLTNISLCDRFWGKISLISKCLMCWLLLHWESSSTCRHVSERERVSKERAQKNTTDSHEDDKIAHMIFENFRATGANEAVERLSDFSG